MGVARETPRWNIRTGLKMSLTGMLNVGHEVGGFAGPTPDPELFLRWLQPAVTAYVATVIQLRYTLKPQPWSLSRGCVHPSRIRQSW